MIPDLLNKQFIEKEYHLSDSTVSFKGSRPYTGMDDIYFEEGYNMMKAILNAFYESRTGIVPDMMSEEEYSTTTSHLRQFHTQHSNGHKEWFRYDRHYAAILLTFLAIATDGMAVDDPTKPDATHLQADMQEQPDTLSLHHPYIHYCDGRSAENTVTLEPSLSQEISQPLEDEEYLKTMTIEMLDLNDTKRELLAKIGFEDITNIMQLFPLTQMSDDQFEEMLIKKQITTLKNKVLLSRVYSSLLFHIKQQKALQEKARLAEKRRQEYAKRSQKDDGSINDDDLINHTVIDWIETDEYGDTIIFAHINKDEAERLRGPGVPFFRFSHLTNKIDK